MENSSNQDHQEKAPEFAKKTFENFADAFRSGSSAGSDKARAAVPQVKENLAGALHDLIYGLAYGGSFAGTFGQEILPESVKETFAKGAEAGKEAGRKAGEKATNSFKNASDPSAETGQFSELEIKPV